MGKPRMIILIRHAQSEGNKNRDIHQTIPDHRVKLTTEGWSQAHEAGRRLRALLRADDTLHFFTSPYRRTRETTEGILSTLTSDDPSPSPFRRNSIKVYEEPRLREQDFGNFQPCSAEMERMWQERADYGHFFYRIPNGESAADAYDRVSGFNESLWRQFGEEDCASVCVLVTHGLMSRVFLMKWYHFSVEYFEDLRNVNHCEFLIMRKQPDSGKYKLENNLRTWSQLKRDRLAKEKEKNENSNSPTTTVSEKDKEKERKVEAAGAGNAIPTRKKWGGCPNGCDHGKHSYKRENSMHAMQTNGRVSTSSSPVLATSESQSPLRPVERRPTARRWQSSSEEDEDDPRGRVGPPNPHPHAHTNNEPQHQHPLDPTPPFTSTLALVPPRLKAPKNKLLLATGRDFGGSTSGVSEGGSDTESHEEPDPDHEQGKKMQRRSRIRVEKAATLRGTETGAGTRTSMLGREASGMGRGVLADALGDQSDADADGDGDVGSEGEDAASIEEREKSVLGSVY